MGVNETVKDLFEFYERLNDMIKSKSNTKDIADDKPLFFYRGDNIADDGNFLKPKINKFLKCESQLFDTMMTRCPAELKDKHTTFEKLTYLQHYGMYTRLLDVTENPLVALYFACGIVDEADCKDTDKAVIIYKISRKNLKYWNSDAVAVLSNFARMKHEDKEEIVKEFQGIQKAKGVSEEKELIAKMRSSGAYKRYLAKIQEEKPYFTDVISLNDFNNGYAVVKPLNDNPRLIAQQGAFILFGMNFNGNELECSKINNTNSDCDCVDIIRLGSFAERKKIKEQLKVFANIDQARLMPETDKIVEQIKKEFEI